MRKYKSLKTLTLWKMEYVYNHCIHFADFTSLSAKTNGCHCFQKWIPWCQLFQSAFRKRMELWMVGSCLGWDWSRAAFEDLLHFLNCESKTGWRYPTYCDWRRRFQPYDETVWVWRLHFKQSGVEGFFLSPKVPLCKNYYYQEPFMGFLGICCNWMNWLDKGVELSVQRYYLERCEVMCCRLVDICTKDAMDSS